MKISGSGWNVTDVPVRSVVADLSGGVLGLALAVFLLPDLAVPVHFGPEVGGQGVDAAHADPVQTGGDLVAVLVEFSAGTNLGHHDLQGTDAFLLVDADRNAPAVVVDGDSIAGR